MKCDALDIFAKRHSYYEINKTLPLTKEEINEIIYEILKFYPSSYNVQESRLLVLYGNENQKFWQLVEQELYKTATEDKTDAIKKRIASFSKGAGTIIYFIDTKIIRAQEQKFPLYASNFKNWAIQGSAMLQYMIWNAFAEKHIGANLQHYNPLIDASVKEVYKISESWELVAQMPFGGIEKIPEPHQADDVKSKVIILK